MERIGNPSSIRHRRMDGQAVVMFTLALLIMLMMAGLAVDASGAWFQSNDDGDALTLTRDHLTSNGNAIKYGADGADSMSTVERLVCEALFDRRDGNGALGAASPMTGANSKVTVYAYELPESKTGAADRLIGIEVRIDSSYGTTFMRIAGKDAVPVASVVDFTINPYSNQEVYDADGTARSRGFIATYKVVDGRATRLSRSTITTDSSMPASLKEKVDDALEQIRA